MKRILLDKRASLCLLVVCFITYSLLGFTRSAYTAAIAGIVNDGVFTKLDAGTINSSFYITYSLAQIVGSYFVDKISPFKVITIGLVGTVAANVVMSLSASFWVIFLARAVCGIAQFGIWPALLRIVSDYVCPDYKRRAMYIMPLGITVGTILSFFVASLLLDHGGWQSLFVVSYASLLVIGVFYLAAVLYARKKETEKPVEVTAKTDPAEAATAPTGTSNLRLILISGGVFILIASFCKSMVSAGISSWMPTMIMECYDTSPGFSSILTSIANFSNFVAIGWVVLVYPRLIKNRMVATGFFFALALPLLCVLLFIGQIPLALVVILIMFVNMFKNAIHQFFTVEIPVAYTPYNKSGMMAGIINVFACVGSMIAGTVYGYTADTFGWSATILLWAALTLVGLLACLAALPAWKKFVKKG